MIKGYLEYTSKEIDSHSSKCDNFLLLGDFNSEPTEEAMKSFCQIYNFKNLLDKPTCYKNPIDPLCVDLIITDKPKSFQNSCTFETGLSDLHKMTLTVLKSSFAKQKPTETCLSVVNKIAPLKSRFIRANHAPFINKEIQQAVTVRSKLRKKNS